MAINKRIGIVGGGAESFMGSIHRAAIEQSGCAELVCGAFGSTRHSSFETGKMLGLPPKRAYGTYRDMFRREATLPKDERMDFVVILAPNTMHYPVAMSSIDAGFPVFSEKPYTCNMDEALNLTRKQQSFSLAYGIAFAYAGYPMLQRARALIQEDKALGTIRRVEAVFELGWMTQRLETAGNKQAGWRADPRRCGPAGCLIDLGAHCFHAVEWLTGLPVTEVCADLRATVPGRILDDDCDVLVRFAGGARGRLVSSQVATGARQGLRLTVCGDKGAAIWSQSKPDALTLRGVDGTQHDLTGGTPADEPPPPAAPAPYGNNPAYVAALAETYRSFAAFLDSPKKAAQREGGLCFAQVSEGLRAVAFVDAVLKNTAAPEEGQPPPPKWIPLAVPPIPEL
jgi:predicted dehydrogenase